MRIGGGQTNVFIEVERAAAAKNQFPGAMHFFEARVNGFHGVAGREAEDETRLGAELRGDDARHEFGGGIGVGSNYNFHDGNSRDLE
jgi:hypothetical protein